LCGGRAEHRAEGLCAVPGDGRCLRVETVTFEGRGVEWWALPASVIRISVSIRARFAAFAIKAERPDDFVGVDMLFGGLSEQRRHSQQRSDGERHPDSL
jgi:hypothetical protein